jgi:hypothetical protein
VVEKFNLAVPVEEEIGELGYTFVGTKLKGFGLSNSLL